MIYNHFKPPFLDIKHYDFDASGENHGANSVGEWVDGSTFERNMVLIFSRVSYHHWNLGVNFLERDGRISS